MFKEFTHHIAWTDTMTYEHGYAGLIGYQRKNTDGKAYLLWVIAPNFMSEDDAEISADKMLHEIRDITDFGRVIYSDGVML